MKYYEDLIHGLRSKIEIKFGSIAAFSRESKISRQNLMKIFSGKHDISVGLYLRICSALNDVAQVETGALECAVPLREYLAVNHDMVVRSMLKILLET